MKTVSLLGSLMGLLLWGCAHDRAKGPPDTAAGQPYAGGTQNTPPLSSCVSDADCRGGLVCEKGHCTASKEQLAACTSVRVHFDFDSAEIPSADLPRLEHAAMCLRANRSVKVDIEGNADERGTEEYNFALGDRRAQTVARHLERLGASAEQVRTVSFGEDNPECLSHDEKCWARNRRAAVKLKEKEKEK